MFRFGSTTVPQRYSSSRLALRGCLRDTNFFFGSKTCINSIETDELITQGQPNPRKKAKKRPKWPFVPTQRAKHLLGRVG